MRSTPWMIWLLVVAACGSGQVQVDVRPAPSEVSVMTPSQDRKVAADAATATTANSEQLQTATFALG